VGLKGNKPLVIFCGKLIPRKRPLDLAAAVRLLPFVVNTLFVGDGSLADSVRVSLIRGAGVVTGFVNQSDIPAYYHAADILVLPSESETWALVVNDAMACDTLPVVSDRAGCAPDLASGLGEVFPVEMCRRSPQRSAGPWRSSTIPGLRTGFDRTSSVTAWRLRLPALSRRPSVKAAL